MKINEFDFTDADLLEKIEQGKNDVLEKLKIVEDNITNPVEGIRQECKILRDFLDYVFGEGTSDENIKHKNKILLK